MGTILELEPNSDLSLSVFNNTGGAANRWTALSDDLDTTYLVKSLLGQKTGSAGVTTYTLAAGEVVKRFRVRARVASPGASAAKYMIYAEGRSSTSSSKFYKSSATSTVEYASPTEFLGPWVDCEGNQYWVDNVQASISDYKDTPNVTRFYELSVEIDVVDTPTVTVGAVPTNTTKPIIPWTYADGDDDPQEQYEVRVYERPGASWTGFDPDATAVLPVWETGWTSGSASEIQCPVSLTNGGIYRAYVRVAHSGGSVNGDLWSAWAFDDFTTTITPCTTPTLTATWNVANQRVNLTVNGSAPPALVTQTLRVERSLDAGVTWELVRGCAALIPDGSYDAAPRDYEAVRGITMHYRAKALGVEPGGNSVDSAWSTTATVVTTNDGTWWLKAVSDNTLNTGVVPVLERPEYGIEQGNGIFRPLGLDGAAIVTAGSIGGQDGAFVIDASGASQIAAILALVNHRGVLLLQSPFGDHRYVRITSRSRQDYGVPAAPRVLFMLGTVAVKMPATE